MSDRATTAGRRLATVAVAGMLFAAIFVARLAVADPDASMDDYLSKLRAEALDVILARWVPADGSCSGG